MGSILIIFFVSTVILYIYLGIQTFKKSKQLDIEHKKSLESLERLMKSLDELENIEKQKTDKRQLLKD